MISLRGVCANGEWDAPAKHIQDVVPVYLSKAGWCQPAARVDGRPDPVIEAHQGHSGPARNAMPLGASLGCPPWTAARAKAGVESCSWRACDMPLHTWARARHAHLLPCQRGAVREEGRDTDNRRAPT
eukprot:CAMPEP_0182594560 /NCGR_PEP_ID=MMETSP1324-20130603/80413_1 /TAXON_ID=236786 /ORGANISM="Florenciella sp., Strain RCC1587" /LENGTH=127 /DNA_ID=CAMNT_0024812115 /DNA_START=486 /DNA_END=866 /DNA_ORIENTATION=-